MSIETELQEASYRGAVFFLTAGTTAGGRKDVLKEIVNSDRQLVEDFGLRQRTFSISGIIAERTATLGTVLTSYKAARDTLLDALEAGGTGQLIHPFYGKIDNVVCRSFSISESMQSVGISPITMIFAISNTTGAPEAEAAVLGTVAAEAISASATLETSVAEGFTATEKFAGNVEDAITKVQDFAAKAQEATDSLTQIVTKIDQFAADLAQLSADAASLVQTPADLAESIRNTVQSMNGLFATPQAIFDSMKRLFDFGDLDVNFTTDTAGNSEKQDNRDLLNNQIQGAALAECYVAAAQLDLDTVAEIDATQQILEAQFQKMVDTNTLDSAAQEGLTETRIALTSFFNAQRADKPRLIEVETPTLPARVLAYQYYGSSAQGARIADLNSLDDSAFVEGRVEILSS